MNCIVVIPDTCLCSQSFKISNEGGNKVSMGNFFPCFSNLIITNSYANIQPESFWMQIIYWQNATGQLSVFKHHETLGLRCSGCSGGCSVEAYTPINGTRFCTLILWSGWSLAQREFTEKYKKEISQNINRRLNTHSPSLQTTCRGTLCQTTAPASLYMGYLQWFLTGLWKALQF